MSSAWRDGVFRLMLPVHFPTSVRERVRRQTCRLLAALVLATTPAAAQESWSESAQLRLAAAVAQATGRAHATGAETDSFDAPAVALVSSADLLRRGVALGTEDLPAPTELLARTEVRLRSIAEQPNAEQSLAERAAALLAALHQQFLTGEYRPNCPGVHATLLRGDYNCLTAATLYLLAAERAGLPCQLYERPGHVWCLVREGQQTCLVETLAVDGVQSVAGAPAGQPLSRRQVLARLHYNAALSAFHARAFDRSLRLSDVALRLDATYAPAWHNLAAALNNWAVELARAGRSDAALELLQAATMLLPAEQDLQRNLAALQSARRFAVPLRPSDDERMLLRTN